MVGTASTKCMHALDKPTSRLAKCDCLGGSAMQIQTKELMQPSAHWRWWHESKVHTFHEVLANYMYRWGWTSLPDLPLRLAKIALPSATTILSALPCHC